MIGNEDKRYTEDVISLRNEWEIIYKNRENPILVDLKNYLSFTNVIEVFVKFVVLYSASVQICA